MADLPTIMETGGGFGGASMGAGFIGGLVLGSLWNGGGFGGNGNRAGQVGADVTLANAIEHVSDQVQQGTISQLQSAAGVTASVNANTVAGLQSQNAMQQQMCCCCNNLSREIDNTGDGITAAITNGRIQDMQNTQTLSNQLCGLNGNISAQGYENRLQAQALAAQLQNQHADLSRQIFEENCKDRELQREIQAQAIRDKLAEQQAKNAALEAQINLQQQLTNQTLYLINQLKPAATTAAAA